jgi:hypothetical protein
MELVAHHVGQQHLERAEEEQDGQRGGDERRPQPGLVADEARALAQLAAQRALGLGRGQRSDPQRPDARRAEQERAGVDEEGAAGAGQRHDQAAERRADQPRARLPHELIERVGLHQVLGGHDVGHERAEGGTEERLAGPEQRDEADEVPDLERPRERERADGEQHAGADEVGADQHAPALDAIADDAAGEQEGHHPAGERQPDER